MPSWLNEAMGQTETKYAHNSVALTRCHLSRLGQPMMERACATAAMSQSQVAPK